MRFVIAVVVVEAIAEIVSDSALFAPIRKRLIGWNEEKPRWLGVLVSCGYCLSVWFGIGAVMLYGAPRIFPELPLFVEELSWGFVVHRASNVWHAAVRGFTNLMRRL
jgi:hypothetical protein